MRKQEQGQVLVYGLAALVIVATVMVLLYNTGQASSEKSRTVNAADAAAYSGGIWVARQLNFMAYTNRAMIANHVAVGHFVSYMSWIRYVEDSSDTIRQLTRFIPYVNVATEILARWATYVRSGTEYFGDLFVPATDYLNLSIHAAQRVAKLNMMGVAGSGSLTPLHELMEKTARVYHPRLRVNHPDDLASLSGAVTGVQIVGELLRVFALTDRYDASDDEGRIKALIEGSLAHSKDWIEGNRGWTQCLLISCRALPSNIRAGKSGDTEHQDSDGKLGWAATDELGIWKAKKKRTWSSYRWSGGTVADGEATAKEFQREYTGIHGYYALADDQQGQQVLFISAYTTLPVEAVRMKPLLGMAAGEPRLAALARAEVYHERPKSYGDGSGGEYSNVFNPFWRARLTGYKPFFAF